MRPLPPEILIEEYVGIDYFIPSLELNLWVINTFLNELSPLYNQEHEHLSQAHIGYMWTNVPHKKDMKTVAAMVEIPFFRGNAWQKHRAIMQMQEWFGGIPDFVITFDAQLAQSASDLVFCGRMEHELYHCAIALDNFGTPKFNNKTGQPKFAICGHSVEEHTGVIRRYGIGAGAGETIAFVEAANRQPEIGVAEIEGVCGTC